MTIYINGVKTTSTFFDNFNWFNFEYGDIVWLEDCDDINAIAGYVIPSNDGEVHIKTLSNYVSIKLIDLGAENIHQAIGA